MYGLVNKALEEMIVLDAGAEAWEEIKRRAGVSVDVFISSEGYDDEMTYKLVGAACEYLAIPADKLLEQFGVHWVVKTAGEGYGDLMTAGGRTLREFLNNLPNFHNRVCLLMPHLKPPEFRCSDAGNNSVQLHYHSHRQGLAPFVVGLIKGLSIRFDTPVEITHSVKRGEGADHDVFVINWANESDHVD
jgi:heme-NO-binding protein